MKHDFNTVIDGVSRYINNEIYSNMNDLQEFVARVFIGRFISIEDAVRQSLFSNGFIRTFGIIDADGKVDVDSLARDIKREIKRKEKLTLSIPMFGEMTFSPSDVDVLYRTITGEEMDDDDN